MNFPIGSSDSLDGGKVKTLQRAAGKVVLRGAWSVIPCMCLIAAVGMACLQRELYSLKANPSACACAFTSELFYESRLNSRPGLELEIIKLTSRMGGSGLRFLPWLTMATGVHVRSKQTRSETASLRFCARTRIDRSRGYRAGNRTG